MAIPPPYPTTSPDGSPALAGWADTFTPTLSAGPDPGAPSLGPVMPQDQAGDTFPIGGSFSTATTFQTYSQTTGGDALQTTAVIRSLAANRVVLSLSDSIPANSMVLVYGILAGAYSTPAVIGRADAWWCCSHATGSTSVIVGNTVSVFGRNLSKDNAFPYDTSNPSVKCMIWLYNSELGAGQYATCTSINPYRAQFTMPAMWNTTPSASTAFLTTGAKNFVVAVGLAYPAGLRLTIWNVAAYMLATVVSYSGSSLDVNVTEVEPGITGSASLWTIEPMYDVDAYIHNGHGGAYGWSRKVTLSVTNAQALGINYDKFVVDCDDPNGVDDTTMINNNIALVANDGPATLDLHFGTYKVSSRINLTGGFGKAIRLRGVGRASTSIIPTAGFSGAAGEIIASSAMSQLEDIGVAFNGITNETTIRIARIVDCDLFVQDPSTIDFLSGSSCYMTGCNVIAPYVDLLGVTSAYIDSCNFYGTDMADQLVHSGGGTNICFTNNTGQHYDPDPLGDNLDKTHGRFFVGESNVYGAQRNVYIADNSTPTPLNNPEGFGDGEIFLWDGAVCPSSSLATAATSTTVTITDTPDISWISKFNAAITGGLGEGQSRRITNVVGNQLTIDPPWDLTPDTTSRINITGGATRVVVYNNTVQGGNILNDGSEQGDSQGFNLFTGGNEIIVDGNTFTDMHYGYSEWAISTVAALTEGAIPLFFNLVCNNTFVHCNHGIRTVIDDPVGGETVMCLGNVIRNNTWTNTITDAWLMLEPFYFTDLMVMQDNSITGEFNGIKTVGPDMNNAKVVVIDTSFVGGGGGISKIFTTVIDVGSTSYVNFENASQSGVGFMNINFSGNIIVVGY